MKQKSDLRAKLRLGFFVFGSLIVLEIIEYAVGVSMKRGAWPYLAVMAVVAAWPILYYFMHISHLWRPRE